eukprot:12908252-Prorocentrum_lima.AAC.1
MGFHGVSATPHCKWLGDGNKNWGTFAARKDAQILEAWGTARGRGHWQCSWHSMWYMKLSTSVAVAIMVPPLIFKALQTH